MSIDINVFPMGESDCIHIRFSDNMGVHNIIIDSGPSSRKRLFRCLLEQLHEAGECVDLLCFTHIHDDHIKGAELVLSEKRFDSSLIRMAWLNIEDAEDNSNTNDMSIASSLSLQKHLKELNIPINNSIIAGNVFYIGEAKITVISPNEVKRDAFNRYWKKKIKGVDMSSIDKSVANGDSIAFVFSFNGSNVLFLGDAHIDAVIEGIQNYCPNITFEVVKLAHHGRIANVNSKLLDTVNTKTFIISASSDGMSNRTETLNLISSYDVENEKQIFCNFDTSYVDFKNDKVKMVNLTQEIVKINDITIRSEEV